MDINLPRSSLYRDGRSSSPDVLCFTKHCSVALRSVHFLEMRAQELKFCPVLLNTLIITKLFVPLLEDVLENINQSGI
jgi:hypothetical protein